MEHNLSPNHWIEGMSVRLSVRRFIANKSKSLDFDVIFNDDNDNDSGDYAKKL